MGSKIQCSYGAAGIYVQQPLVQVAQINEDIVPAGVVHLIAFILFFK